MARTFGAVFAKTVLPENTEMALPKGEVLLTGERTGALPDPTNVGIDLNGLEEEEEAPSSPAVTVMYTTVYPHPSSSSRLTLAAPGLATAIGVKPVASPTVTVEGL